MAKRVPWVTEQGAIDTLIALGGLQPGDRVKIKDAINVYVNYKDGKVVTVAAVTGLKFITHDWCPGGCWRNKIIQKPVVFRCEQYAWVRENILAWRRPKEKK